jgi:hypothetical protein
MGLPQDPFYLFHSPIAVPFRLSCFVGFVWVVMRLNPAVLPAVDNMEVPEPRTRFGLRSRRSDDHPVDSSAHLQSTTCMPDPILPSPVRLNPPTPSDQCFRQ